MRYALMVFMFVVMPCILEVYIIKHSKNKNMGYVMPVAFFLSSFVPVLKGISSAAEGVSVKSVLVALALFNIPTIAVLITFLAMRGREKS